ncbi:hypothetical protein LCGC14_2468520 [marine sediment metagenome]|uniref:Uncharacterized protein n=1 Tax=marine sediment metagenome TaxID=412755 RepID=A0A0F9E540_9ZZZZ
MSGSVSLGRHVTLETIGVEVFLNVDGIEGAPAYDTPVSVQARVLRQDKVLWLGDGSHTTTVLTVWFPQDTSPLPDHRARLEWEDEFFIIEQVKDVKDRNATLVHRRVRCRRE